MLQAEQLLYTRVEAPYSPRRSSGYQTVYRSRSLTPEDVLAIEKALGGFPGRGSPELVRLQYFRLGDGRCVLTHTVAVEPDREIVDRSGRRGPYLAHCLVLSAADFQRLDNNPFAVFAQQGGLFLTEAGEMVERLGKQFQDAPPLELEILPDEPDPDWSAEQLNQLVRLGMQAPVHLRARQAVLFVGEQEPIHQALRLLFNLIRKPHRLPCTFDTLVGNWDAFAFGTTWAAGARACPADSTVQSKVLLVDAGARQVRAAETLPDHSSDLYSRWLARAWDRHPSARILQLAPAMEQLASIHEGGGHAGDLDGEALGEFFRCFPEVVRTRLRSRLQTVLTSRLTRGLMGFLERGLQDGIAPWWLGDPVPGKDLGAWLLAWIRYEQPRLSFRDRGCLRKFAREGRCWPLLHWMSVLGWFVHRRDRDEALATMNDREFQQALALLGRPIAPEHYVARSHVPALLQALPRALVTEAQFLRLLAALLNVGAGGELGPLACRVPGLSPRGLLRLDALLRGHPQAAPDLVQVVHRELTPFLPGRPGISLG